MHKRTRRGQLIVRIPTKPKRPEKRTPEQRIGERITVQPNGCWIYGDNPAEYGKMSANGSPTSTHRFVWETLKGPIPDGLHLHHTCETLACCNPAHLRALTPFEHQQAHRDLRQAKSA